MDPDNSSTSRYPHPMIADYYETLRHDLEEQRRRRLQEEVDQWDL